MQPPCLGLIHNPNGHVGGGLHYLALLRSAAYVQEGIRGFYRGWAPNALKVVPQNSLRFASFEALKVFFGT